MATESNSFLCLTYFNTKFHFNIPWKRQKAKGFLTFSGGIEMEHWANNGLNKPYNTSS